MKRRTFIKRGALFVPALFLPRFSRAQDPMIFAPFMARQDASAPSLPANVIESDGADGSRISGMSIAVGTTFTIQGWIYPIPTSDGFGTILTQGATNGLYYNGTDDKLNYYNGGTNNSTAAFTPNQWSHFACVSSSGSGTHYINGSSSGSFSAGAQTFDSIFDSGGGHNFKGRIGNLSVHSIALNGTQVSNLFNKTTTPVAIGSLLAYLKLDDVANGASGNGATFVDSSGNGETGTGAGGLTGRTSTI